MDIIRGEDGKFRIRHAEKIVTGLKTDLFYKPPVFDTHKDADNWADAWIDDQVFDSENWFSPPLEYRQEERGA